MFFLFSSLGRYYLNDAYILKINMYDKALDKITKISSASWLLLSGVSAKAVKLPQIKFIISF